MTGAHCGREASIARKSAPSIGLNSGRGTSPREFVAPSTTIRWALALNPILGRWVLPFAVAALMFILPPFVRETRPLSPFIALPIVVSAVGALVGLTRSNILCALAALVAVMVVALMFQFGFGHVPDLALALRQQFYYAHCVVATLVAAFLITNHRHEIFSGMALATAAVLYSALSLSLDSQFAGDFDIRGNFECGTAFFVIGYVFWSHDRALRLYFGFLVLFLFSLYTHSAQGSLVAIVMLALLPLCRVLRGVVVFCFAFMPVLFPLVLPFIVDIVGALDSNVAIRQQMWSALLSYLSEDFGFFGLGFGVGSYQAIFEYALLDYIRFKRLENIGMHNGILQIAAFVGIIGIAFGILLLLTFARTALRHLDDTRVLVSYFIVILSLTLNQAFTHLVVELGTALALAVLVNAEWTERRFGMQRMRVCSAGTSGAT